MLRRLVGITLAVLVALSAHAGAQESASSAIVGVVTDTTQAALPGATVTVTQVGTSAQRVVVTDNEGRFSVPGLRPATYSVRADLPQWRDRPSDLDARSRQPHRADYRDRRVVAVANAERFSRSGDFRKDDRRPAAQWPRRAVADGVVGRSHSASVQSRHAIRSSRKQS